MDRWNPRNPRDTVAGMARVLVVEDHDPLARVIAEGLAGAGYEPDVVADGRAAVDRVTRGEYVAVVLDWMLPGMDGLAVVHRLRSAGYDVPVVLLTARDAVSDRVRGLDAGADDYLIKPFALDELLARLRAAIRRRKGGTSRVVEIEDLRVDTGARRAHRGDREIPLSSREYAVLECLALNRGRIVTRDQLLAHTYPGEHEPASNIIDVYVAHLRRKIDDGGGPRLIHTRRGLGYLLGVSP
jgi:two-component system, OmpR family, copper resistance phosphate regulon response regulator CusR